MSGFHNTDSFVFWKKMKNSTEKKKNNHRAFQLLSTNQYWYHRRLETFLLLFMDSTFYSTGYNR